MIHLDYYLRTDNGTSGTAGAISVGRLSREVTVFIGFFGDDDAIVRTYYYTQAATFASFGINNYFAGHFLVYRIAYLVFSPRFHRGFQRTGCILTSLDAAVKRKGDEFVSREPR